MKRILVTGGAGFIGSHLCDHLLGQGCGVRVLDNFDPFYPADAKRHHLLSMQKVGAGFELIEGDLRNPGDCQRAVESVDAVVHLAALAGVRPSIADPARYMDVNVTGTQTLLSALTDRPGVPIIFGSSSSVYGGNRKVPFSESDPVDRPVSPYAASKKAGEVLCHSHHHLHGNPITCLRFFTVYGQRQRPEMAIHLFSRKILAGEPIPVYGDGSTSRDYTYVGDIVGGIIAALDHAADGYEIYNLGGSVTTKLTELITLLEETFDKKAIIDRHPEQPGDVATTWADTNKAKSDLGYDPQVNLRHGLEQFANWYRRERQEGRLA